MSVTIRKWEPKPEPVDTIDTNPDIPGEIFPIPGNSIGNNLAAEKIFRVIGRAQKMFIREGTVTEVFANDGVDYLASVTPERFCGLVEKFNHRVAKFEQAKGPDGYYRKVWRSKTFPITSAKIILETDAAKDHLPPIRQMANCPILTPEGNTLQKGYHSHAGGTFISAGRPPEAIPFEQAKGALKGILGDFDFASPSDFSRGFASLISPALKMGGWINDDFPLDMAEADKSQSGKTFRQKIVCRIYKETPSSITMATGGVGSLDEKIATALLRGRPFVTLGNIRGKVTSQILEEAIRGAGHIQCRTLRRVGFVDCSPFLWQLSTNGAELTRDLANRTIVTKIRKQPDGYQWKTYPEGGLESHINQNQGFYLGCVFSILREWARQGRPRTKEQRHDFHGWCQALDAIVQMCDLSPLLDGHKEEQERTANPNLQWLREILLALPRRDLGQKVVASYLAEIGEENGILFPGNPHSRDEPHIRAGRILGKIFRDGDSEEITVDRFRVRREVAPDYSPGGDGRERKQYTVDEL